MITISKLMGLYWHLKGVNESLSGAVEEELVAPVYHWDFVRTFSRTGRNCVRARLINEAPGVLASCNCSLVSLTSHCLSATPTLLYEVN